MDESNQSGALGVRRELVLLKGIGRWSLLSPDSDCIPGGGSNQVYLNVSLLRKETGGLQDSLATLILFIFYLFE